MANPNIKFYRSSNEPSNPANGSIWFKDDGTIQLYRNNNWEIYTGKINDITYNDGLLNVSKRNSNQSFTINIGEIINNINNLEDGLEENEKAWAGFLNEFNTRLNDLDASGIKSAIGQNYINAVVDSGTLTISTITGSISDETEGLATTPDVKNYINEMFSWAEY